ncbi:hypothetical protein [Clostridium sp.]|uniref:hypothetical protein n=1 Tax=Clostridium sp. TaxID=1506 RepID=UPI0026312C1C|nr:hypothetical protein [Clostridium sp.]
MQNFFLMIVVSILAESIWETLKMAWDNGKVSIDKIGALVVSLLITLGTKLDLLSLLGLETTIPYMGSILTGIIISRGSNFTHDLLVKVSNIKE